MSISRICLFVLLVIGSLAIWKYGSDVVRSAQDYRTVERLETLAEAGAIWKDATVALSLERSVMQVALAVREPASRTFLDLIEGQRVLADGLFAEAQEALKTFSELPTKDAFSSQARAALNRVSDLRAEVDAMLALPNARRDQQRVKDLPFELKETIAELKVIANLLSIENSLTSNTAFALVSIQNLAWEVREFGGRARTYYAIATLTGRPIPPDVQSLILADSARAARAWSEMQKAVLVARPDEAFARDIERVGAHYFGDYLGLVATLDESMKARTADYPVTFDEFFAQSNDALDGFANLSKRAGEEVRLYWENRKLGKLNVLIFDVVVALSIISLIIAATVFISRRVASRVQYATAAIAAVADGDTTLEVDSRTNDLAEIKALTTSLEKLIVGTRKTHELMATLDDVEVREKERAEAEKARTKLLESEAQAQAEREKAMADEAARLRAFESFQRDLQSVLGAASNGQFDRRMPVDPDHQNLADLAHVINEVLSAMEGNISDIVWGIGELAQGNLAVRMEGERKGAFLKMKEDFNAALEAVSSSMATILRGGQSVSATSGELQTAASTMSKRAEGDAIAVQETSAAIDSMTTRVREVVESAKAANAATRNIQARANQTRDITDTTEASMGDMKRASTEINRVVRVIEDIAFQINLLALNAGVEAARAGEAGRGFSVVASEVRALAQRSQDAVQDVNRVIGENTAVVDSSIANVEASRTAVEGIVSEVGIASEQISAIASAIEQQARGISDINGAITAVETSAKNNAASLEKLTASSVSLTNDAGVLSQALSKFQGVSDQARQMDGTGRGLASGDRASAA
ncbi:MAG: methyl-accepting chemotaxis protein [Pseudomonadota bacterium]